MKRHTITLCLAPLALTLALPALAQPPVGGPGFGDRGPFERMNRRGGSERLFELLELSEQQQEEWKALHEEFRETMHGIGQGQRELMQQLHTLLDSDNPDPAAVGTLVLEQHAAREQSKTAREALEADIEALLTPEQLEKYETYQAARADRRGPRGARRGRHGGPA